MECQDYFSFVSAGEIRFGKGCLGHLPGVVKTKIKANKPLVISDPGVVAGGLLEPVYESLSREKIPFERFEDTEQEPSLPNVLACVDANKGKGCDCVVAIGGGSVIDLGKAVAVMLRYGGNIRDYFGQEALPGEPVPIVASPTTAGTGSEVTAGAILSDVDNNTKVGIRSNWLRPRVALVDPESTYSCPKGVTANAGFDVLAHAVESFTMAESACMPKGTVIFHGSNQITEPLAASAIELVGKFLPIVVHQGSNREARDQMMMASLLAGLAFSNSGVTDTHMISYPVGTRTHAPHGALLATLLPVVLEYNLPIRKTKLARVARLLGENTDGLSERDAALKGIEAIRTLIKEIQLPATLRDLGLDRADIPAMADTILPVLRGLPMNPRAMERDDLIGIYERSY
jgi:alcohol dehydrogenase